MNINNSMIFQYSTINALVAGIYEGNLTIDQLGEYGDMGLGTFNHLDGEMVALDGEFYKVKAMASPTVLLVSPDEKIPFAVVTHFNSNIHRIPAPSESLNFKQLQEYIDSKLNPGNAFYAFKMEGNFKYIKTRSMPYQEGPTYPRLTQVVETQVEYTFENIEGFLVGFWFPFYMKDINVPGYHFHFLSRDKTKGGHLFECQTTNLAIRASCVGGFRMILPDCEKFREIDLTVSEEELAIIEKGKIRKKGMINKEY